jgi:hypothetical protein
MVLRAVLRPGIARKALQRQGDSISMRAASPQLHRPRSFAGVSCLLALVAIVLAGCGSTSPAVSPPSAASAQTTSTADPTTSNTSAAAPSTDGPPSFVVNATTQEGDKVSVEGRFGPALPASESDVDQTALSECPSPASDGRAIVVRLDLTTTLESSLSGEVTLEAAHVDSKGIVNFVLGFSEGARCVVGEANEASVKLGTMQPGQSADFTMWVVLPNAITPEVPQPTVKELGEKDWLMTPIEPSVNGSSYLEDQHNRVSGSRVVKCHPGANPSVPSGPEDEYLAVVGDTATTLLEAECPVS